MIITALADRLKVEGFWANMLEPQGFGISG